MKAYADMLPPLHAERQMLAIEAAASPYMEKSARQEIVRRYARAIRGEKPRSLNQAFEDLGLVVEVPKEVKRDGRRARKGEPRA